MSSSEEIQARWCERLLLGDWILRARQALEYNPHRHVTQGLLIEMLVHVPTVNAVSVTTPKAGYCTLELQLTTDATDLPMDVMDDLFDLLHEVRPAGVVFTLCLISMYGEKATYVVP